MKNRSFSIKSFILIIIVLVITIPLIVFGIIEFDIAGEGAGSDVQKFIENDIIGTKLSIEILFDSVQAKVESNLTLAEFVLASNNHIYLDMDNIVEMKAIDQNTKESSNISLPVMMLGEEILSYNYTLVDKIQSYVGGTATIFQIIPEGLLRVSTNILKEDSSRAVGTYIPKVSDIYKVVMDGDTFYERVYIVNDWYISAYRPIFDLNNEIIAVLHAGIKESLFKEKILTSLSQKKLGDNGYYEVVDGNGYYALSNNIGLRGKNSFDIKDANGTTYMHSLVNEAISLGSGKIGSHSYNWKKSEKEITRKRTATFLYFEPWDWIVIANIYNGDFIKGSIGEDLGRIVLIITIFLIIGIILAFFIARAISNPLLDIQQSVVRISKGNLTKLVEIHSHIKEIKLTGTSIDTKLIPEINKIVKEILNSIAISGNINNILQNYSKEVSDVTYRLNDEIGTINNEMMALDEQILEASSAVSQILATIETLAAHIYNQFTTVSQTSVALEEITISIDSISKIASEKADSTRILISTLKAGQDKLSLSNDHIKDISIDVDNMMNIIGFINDIASKTNLLAMNAAIEAVHAGKYGKGFSVVADEIRKLAKSTSSNAKIISNSLKEAAAKMGAVLDAGEESEKAFINISKEVTNFVDGFMEITNTTSEVSQGTREILSSTGLLVDLSRETSDASQEIKLSSQDINNSVIMIKDASKKVVNKVADVKTGLGSIGGAQEDIVGTVGWSSENIKKIETGMKYFTLMDEISIPDSSKLNLSITNFLVNHHKLLDGASNAIGGAIKLDSKEASDYKSCELGLWLLGKGKDLYDNNGAFELIVENHKKFHNSLASILENIDKNKRSDVFISYDIARQSYKNIIQSFRELINV